MRYTLAAGTALLAILAAAPLQAQSEGIGDPARAQLGREELTSMLQRVSATSGSPAPGDRASAEVQEIRKRLTEGDFSAGDQVMLTVMGDTALTGTFTVRAGPVLTLPDIADIPLKGVLRSELEAYLRTQLSNFVRDPQVQARALMRITISGAVARPGFFMVPAQALLTEAVMQAGGISPGANLKKIRIERIGVPIWKGEALQQAISEGATLDQMSLRAGDHVVVPERPVAAKTEFARTAAVIIPAVVVVLGALRAVF